MHTFLEILVGIIVIGGLFYWGIKRAWKNQDPNDNDSYGGGE